MDMICITENTIFDSFKYILIMREHIESSLDLKIQIIFSAFENSALYLI